jgi:RNA polymerase sigma-70 factor (ECF subfamily)
MYAFASNESRLAAPADIVPVGAADIWERVLIERSLGGDHDAFAELVTRHDNAVFQLAWRILRVREDAEDAAQETFLRAWRSLSRFDRSRKFHPWLMRIAANVAISAAQRRRSIVVIHDDRALESIPDVSHRSPDAFAARHETLEAIESILSDLPLESAALFQLRFGQELSIEDISVILKKKPGAVAVALHRLRERFRRAIFGAEDET